MIQLDTNVVSELMRPQPEPRVIRWLDRRRQRPLAIAAVSIMEIRLGLHGIDPGVRKDRLIAAFEDMVTLDLQGRVLSFDKTAAEATADYVAALNAKGHSIEVVDSQIAGTAIALGATLATHNLRHFPELPIEIVDPWTD